jgi:hypothetical protein
VGGGVQLGPLGTAATNRPILPAPRDYDDGEIGGMIGRGNRSCKLCVYAALAWLQLDCTAVYVYVILSGGVLFIPLAPYVYMSRRRSNRRLLSSHFCLSINLLVTGV